MSVKQKTLRMKNKTTKTLSKHTMAESSNNKYIFFFSLFMIIGICLEFWSWFLRKLLSYYASFFSYKLIWDFEKPLKIVEVILNFAKSFSWNSEFNICTYYCYGVLLFFSFLHKFESFKTKLDFAEAFEVFSNKVIWRVVWKSYI